jgi:hypothetical protein
MLRPCLTQGGMVISNFCPQFRISAILRTSLQKCGLTKVAIYAVADIQNWTSALLQVSRRSRFTFLKTACKVWQPDLCLSCGRPGFDFLTQRFTFVYALKEQHFFRKLMTAEKIAIANMQLRSNISLQSCGYAVAEALLQVAELRLRK